MPKSLYLSTIDEHRENTEYRTESNYARPMSSGPSVSQQQNSSLYKSADLQPGQLYELALRNDDPKSVLTWDFDVVTGILQFTVFRCTTTDGGKSSSSSKKEDSGSSGNSAGPSSSTGVCSIYVQRKCTVTTMACVLFFNRRSVDIVADQYRCRNAQRKGRTDTDVSVQGECTGRITRLDYVHGMSSFVKRPD